MAGFCRQYGIVRISFFGSVLREDFGPESDVDVLVEFKPGQVPGFIRLYQLEKQLSQLLGHPKIDLVTPKSINRRIRHQVLTEAQVQYAER